MEYGIRAIFLAITIFFKATNEMAQKCAHFFPLEITLELEENCCWKFMCNGFLLFSIHIFGNSHKKENVMSLGAHFTRMKMFIFLG